MVRKRRRTPFPAIRFSFKGILLLLQPHDAAAKGRGSLGMATRCGAREVKNAFNTSLHTFS